MTILEQKAGDISKISLVLSDSTQSVSLKEQLDGGVLGETKISIRAFFSNEDNAPETPLIATKSSS